MPRLVNSGMWSVTSCEAGAGAGREIGRAVAAPAAGDAFEPAEEVVEEVGGLLQAPAMQLAGRDARPCPSVGCAPQSAPVSSYWIGS